MRKLIAVVFVLGMAMTSSTQAMTRAPVQQPDTMVTKVAEACGVGFQRVRGVCVRNSAVRTVRRCAAGMRLVGGRCIR